MDTLAAILPLLKPDDWAVSVGLADAYHHVPIATQSRRLLGFAFAGRVYPYGALPFELSPAPRYFYLMGIRGRGVPTRTRGANFLLLRRLTDSSNRPAAPDLGSGSHTGASTEPRVHCQREKILPRHDTVPQILGGRDRSAGPVGPPLRSEGRHYLSGDESPRARRSAPARVWIQLLGAWRV